MTSICEDEFRMLPPNLLDYRPRHAIEDDTARSTEQTGWHVGTKFDTEADKSVSLYRELVKEADRPRCDLCRNRQALGPGRLADPIEHATMSALPTDPVTFADLRASTLRLRNFMSFSLIGGNDNEHRRGRLRKLDMAAGAVSCPYLALRDEKGRCTRGL